MTLNYGELMLWRSAKWLWAMVTKMTCSFDFWLFDFWVRFAILYTISVMVRAWTGTLSVYWEVEKKTAA